MGTLDPLHSTLPLVEGNCSNTATRLDRTVEEPTNDAEKSRNLSELTYGMHVARVDDRAARPAATQPLASPPASTDGRERRRSGSPHAGTRSAVDLHTAPVRRPAARVGGRRSRDAARSLGVPPPSPVPLAKLDRRAQAAPGRRRRVENARRRLHGGRWIRRLRHHWCPSLRR